MPVLEPQPIRDLLGIEADSAADAETRKLTSCRHAVDVFVVHSQEFGQVGRPSSLRAGIRVLVSN